MFTLLWLCSLFTLTLQVLTPEILDKIPPVDFCLADASKSEVYYYLFKSASQTTAIVLTEDYIFSEGEKKLPTKLIMHGYTSNVTSPWYKEIKRKYFEKGPHNIIYVDWSIPANKSFAVSAANIKPVGEYIADFIRNLQVPLQNVHIIGHSLGSQLAGFIGRNIYLKTGQKISRITATDAAGPGFENAGPEARLSKYDATFVDVIHTDVGYFGITKPIGHVDYYVNFGRHQPGCPTRKEDENCSHARSNAYFIESINQEGIKAKAAKFTEVGRVIASSKSDEAEFGDSAPPTTRGIYYLLTNSTAPFLKKVKK